MYLKSEDRKQNRPADITYCANVDCPYEDCVRHLKQLTECDRSSMISLADFAGVCRKYIGWLVDKVSEV